MTTPRASGQAAAGAGRSSHLSAASTSSATGTNNNNMRRCQSAKAARRPCRSIVPSMVNDTMHKSLRSHSQEPPSRYNHQAQRRTQELPIPPSRDGHNHRPSLSSVDKNDLTRMYDYATWNMYERIVSARRHRLSALDVAEGQPPSSPSQSSSRQDSSSSGCSMANKGAAATTTSATAGMENSKAQPLYKTSSHDESSTLATADETDKSSTTSSSWSRTDSPGTFPGMMSAGLTVSPNLEPRVVHSCPPPGYDHQGNSSGVNCEDDHFIFQLDM